jgi:hypothetical protein
MEPLHSTTAPAGINAISAFLKSPIANLGSQIYKLRPNQNENVLSESQETTTTENECSEAEKVLFFLRILCDVEDSLEKTFGITKLYHRLWKGSRGAVRRSAMKRLRNELRLLLTSSEPTRIHALYAVWKWYCLSKPNVVFSFFAEEAFDADSLPDEKISFVLNTYHSTRLLTDSDYDKHIDTLLLETVSIKLITSLDSRSNEARGTFANIYYLPYPILYQEILICSTKYNHDSF